MGARLAEAVEEMGGESEAQPTQFPTRRRVSRRDIDEGACPPREELEEWANQKGVTLGPMIPNVEWRYRVLCGLWIWRDLDASTMADIPETDLIKHRVHLKEGCVPYASKWNRRLSAYKEKWFTNYIEEGVRSGMYERAPVEESLSRWSAPPVLVTKDPSKKIPVREEEFATGPELRLTFNYHHVVEDLPAVEYPLQSKIHDLLANPSIRMYGKGDLKHGYWAVGVEEGSRHILAFNVPGIGQLRPTRMPQGCRSSSATMAELGKIVFGAIPEPNPEPSLIGKEFDIYVDDMFWGQETFERAFEFVFHHFMPRLAWGMLRMSFKKLQLFMTSIIGIGIVFGVGGALSIRPDRVSKIMKWPTPACKTDVRSFLGAVQICRRWIKNFTEIARPLTRLQGALSEWRWGLVEEASLRLLRNKCATVVSMFGVDENAPVRAYFDASDFAGGFALTQVVGGVERPIIYDSVALSAPQRKYGTYKRELFAIVHFSDKYRHHFTTRHPAVFFTDHKPLVTFLNSDRHDGIYARWAVKLQELNFRFEHIPGKRNIIADGLSRTLFLGEDPEVDQGLGKLIEQKDQEGDGEWFWKDGKGGFEELMRSRKAGELRVPEASEPRRFVPGGEEAVGEAERVGFPLLGSSLCKVVGQASDSGKGVIEEEGQVGDFVLLFSGATGLVEGERGEKWRREEWYRDVYRYLTEGGYLPPGLDSLGRKTLKIYAENFREVEGDLYRFDRPRKRLIPCVREEDVRNILRDAHDETGHYASSQVAKKLQYRAWWPGRGPDIRTYIDGCIRCARWGPAVRSHELQPTLTYKPFDMIGMDFIGPVPISTNGYTYIFHVVDYFSRFTKSWPCKANNTSDAISCLNRFFEEYPLPVCIYSDRGQHFTSDQMKQYLDGMEITHVLSPSGASQSTGMIERANQELEKALKRTAGPHLSAWDIFLGRASRAVNTRTVVALGFTPFELLFGVQPRMPFEFAYPDEEVLALRTFTTEHYLNPDVEVWEESILSRSLELQGMREEMLARWKRSNERMKLSYDAGTKGWKFSPGDLVMLYDNTVGAKSKGGGKFDVQWPGPYIVEGHAGEHQTSYRLKHIHGKTLPGAHHGNHLRLYRPRSGRLAQPFDREPEIGPRAIRKLRSRAKARQAPQSFRTVVQGMESQTTTAERNRLCEEAGMKPRSLYSREGWGIGSRQAIWVGEFMSRQEKSRGL